MFIRVEVTVWWLLSFWCIGNNNERVYVYGAPVGIYLTLNEYVAFVSYEVFQITMYPLEYFYSYRSVLGASFSEGA